MPRNILLPCGPDFYELSSSAADLLPSDPPAYMSLTGSLVHACQTRDDIKDKVSLLCSRNSSPTAGDFAKGIQVLRYLYSTPHIGRVYDSTSTEIVGFSDSAFMIHRHTGRSSTAFFFSVGVNNAPFLSVAKSQESVATCPMTSEYMAANAACKCITNLRRVLHDLGELPLKIIELFMDSNTAINLGIAPTITRKARHIDNAHHYIRELVATHLVKLVHVSALGMRADIMTKYLPRKSFLQGRSFLLNSDAFSFNQECSL